MLACNCGASRMQVWCLRVSHVGDFVLSGGHDRSLRRWDKSDEVFFLEEEKEKRLERILDANEVIRNPDAFAKQGDGSAAVPVPSKSQARCISLGYLCGVSSCRNLG